MQDKKLFKGHLSYLKTYKVQENTLNKVLDMLILFSSFQSSFYTYPIIDIYYFRNQKHFLKERKKEEILKLCKGKK